MASNDNFQRIQGVFLVLGWWLVLSQQKAFYLLSDYFPQQLGFLWKIPICLLARILAAFALLDHTSPGSVEYGPMSRKASPICILICGFVSVGATEVVAKQTSESLQLFQAVISTTIIPLCGFNATNCTTALVRTQKSPRVAQVETRGCRSEMQDYCFNGQCVYHVELDKHSCKCDTGYFGARCGLSNLEVKKPLSDEYVALTAVLILFFLLAISVAIYYFYKWYQNKKGMLAASGNYKVVATETEKDNKLLHV